MRRSVGVTGAARAAALLLLGTATAAATCAAERRVDHVAAPLANLPQGWQHIPQACIDCWIGAYHDSESGAYVRYSIGNVRDSTSEGASKETGTLGSARYEASTLKNARVEKGRALEQASGEKLEDLDPEDTRSLPPAGCDVLAIVFYVENEAWTFDGTVCNPTQEKRIRDLLLGALRLSRGAKSTVHRSSKAVTGAEYERVAAGDSCDKIMTDFGAPEAAHQATATDIGLTYFLRESGEVVGEVDLLCDRTRRVVSKSVRRRTQASK